MLPHPALHPVFETLGYTGGYALYRHQRTRHGDLLSDDHRWWIIAAAALGALLGSRILGLLEYAPARGFHFQQLLAFTGGGKTIVGGLLGGWLAVELLKRLAHIRSRTGDLFAVPLCLGIAIWGAAKQRIGATALRDTFSAEQGKGLIVAGLTGVFIIGSLGTVFTIVYGMAV